MQPTRARLRSAESAPAFTRGTRTVSGPAKAEARRFPLRTSDLPPDCIFCGDPGGSNEHAWPDWLRRYLVPLVTAIPRPRRLNSMRSESGSTGRRNITVQCICDGCNRGWMRKLEDHFNALLKQMMLGHSSVLSPKESFALRRWAIARPGVSNEGGEVAVLVDVASTAGGLALSSVAAGTGRQCAGGEHQSECATVVLRFRHPGG